MSINYKQELENYLIQFAKNVLPTAHDSIITSDYIVDIENMGDAGTIEDCPLHEPDGVAWVDGRKFKTIDFSPGRMKRWTQIVNIVTEAENGQLFAWSYERGLTEMEDASYLFTSVVEVEQYEEVITVQKFRAKG